MVLPESVEVGPFRLSVTRSEASPDLHGETDFRRAHISVHPALKGEMAVGIFLHELCHAIVFCAGQHRDDLRGEEYVTNLGQIVHALAKGNPGLVQYMVGEGPMPGELTVYPYPVSVRSVHKSEVPDANFSDLDEENLTVLVADDLAPDVACWEITKQALAFACYRVKATSHADRYNDLLLPVAGLLVDTVRRNPAVADLLLEPVRREPVLRAVNDGPEMAVS